MDSKCWRSAFEEELKVINQRRGKNPNDESDLVGSAISGGGIRSATFGLGVLEGLKHFGLLRKIDYLSTVSGGGYIGAWLSANCKRAADRQKTALENGGSP
ncbi:MAG: patatin-like phospholipase family protein, partial [Methylosarcina sp.]